MKHISGFIPKLGAECRLEQLSMQPWYDSGVDEKQLSPFLNSISHDALNYLHGPMEKVVAIVENIHKSGKGFQVFVNKSTSLSVCPQIICADSSSNTMDSSPDFIWFETLIFKGYFPTLTTAMVAGFM